MSSWLETRPEAQHTANTRLYELVASVLSGKELTRTSAVLSSWAPAVVCGHANPSRRGRHGVHS